MSRPLKVFCITVVFSLAFAACAPPAGTLLDEGGIRSGLTDDFWVVPRREVYNLGDPYIKSDDLWVFVSNRGLVETVPVNLAQFSIVRNPDAAVPADPIPIEGNEYILVADIVGVGRKLINVSYNGMITNYSIEILDPHNIGSDDFNQDRPGIVIRWQ